MWESTLEVDPTYPVPAGPSGNAGGDTIFRLREGIERFMITDINNPGASAMGQSELPIMWDRGTILEGLNFNHIPGGSNVLYMDGHTEFQKYPTRGQVPNDVPAFFEWIP